MREYLVAGFSLSLEVEYPDLHMVGVVFLMDVEGGPVIAVSLRREKRTACAQSIAKGVDVEVSLEEPQRSILALRQGARRILRADVPLSR